MDRALHRIAQRAISLVHAGRELHGGAPLGLAGGRKAVRMHKGLQVPVRLLERGAVYGVGRLEAEQLEVAFAARR